MHEMSQWTRPAPGSGRVLFPSSYDERESLMGRVLRTASENVHSSVGGILLASGYPHARVFDLAFTRFQNLPDLSRVLGVEESEVRRQAHSEVRRVRKVLRTVRFLGAEVPEYDIMTIRRRISPATLAAEPFHRACWNHGLLPYCPISRELLVDACPACGTALGWYRANGVHGCSSRHCDADLRHHVPELLEERHLAAYRRMAALAAPSDSVASAPVHPALSGMDTGALFELGWRLARVLDPVTVPRIDARRLPPHEIVATLVVADELLAGWPNCFRTALDGVLLRGGTKAASAALTRLRSAANGKTGWHEIGKLLRKTYPDLLRPGRQALRGLDPRIVTGTLANAVIGMSASRFAVIKRATALDTVAQIGSRRAFHDFDVSVVRAFAEANAGSVAAKSVSESFGIAHHGIEQLVVLGMLDEERHPALLAVSRQLLVTRSSLDGLKVALTTASNSYIEDEFPMLIAIKSIAGEKPWAAIITAMLDGRISYRIKDGSGRLFGRIVIDRNDLSILRELRFDRREHPLFAFAPDMTKRDAQEALNINPRLSPQALTDEIGVRARGPRITVTDVARIAGEKISTAEILARFAPGGRRLPQCLKRARVKPAGSAGWNRVEVETLLDRA